MTKEKGGTSGSQLPGETGPGSSETGGRWTSVEHKKGKKHKQHSVVSTSSVGSSQRSDAGTTPYLDAFNSGKAPDADALLLNYRGKEFGGWDELLEVLQQYEHLIGDMIIPGLQSSDYEAVRRYANRFWDASVNEFKKAEEAVSKNDYYKFRNKGFRLQGIAELEDRKACVMLFEAIHQNTSGNVNPREAAIIVKVHVWIVLKLRSIRRLKVITGWGKHSGGRSAVEDMLKTKQVLWTNANRGGVMYIDINAIKTTFTLA